MNYYLKISPSFIFFFISLIFFSCEEKNEDKCIPPELEENIIGSWTNEEQGIYIQCEEDGSFFNGFIWNASTFVRDSTRTYYIQNDSLFVLKPDSTSQSNFTIMTYPIEENRCDEITVNMMGNLTVYVRN